MQRFSSRLSCAVIAAIAVIGCTSTESATDLNPEGPPMIRQVRMFEKYIDPGPPPRERSQRVFAFGTHELADPSEVHEVTSASALNGAVGNPIRIIMDELLVGNNLEEIACRGTVDEDALARVPLNATPEDVTRCAAPDDVLPRTCPASNPNSICICKNEGGCLVGSTLIMKDQPVGILDIDEDGGADETRMIAGSVALKCGAGGAIDVPINLDLSYWNPSGDQNRPAQGGFDALGPAIVLTPNGPMPTNVDCGLVFSDEIVDKQGEKVCTPAGGNVEAGCTPGDTSAFTFKVEALKIVPLSINSGDTGVSPNLTTSPLDFALNVPVKAATVNTTNVTISPAAAGLTVTLTGTNMRTIRLSGATLAPNTNYTVTFTTAIQDTFNQPLPAPVVVTFMTGT